MEIGSLSRLAKRSMTGITRRSSSASPTGAAPGWVDSPPTSRISAPCSTSCKACATAAGGSRYCPPSEKESGVTFTIPITSAGRGKVNSNWRARRIIGNKPETRNPKPERSPKPEARSPKGLNAHPGSSDFALRTYFGFRVSAFGFSRASARPSHLDQLDFIPLRGVNEGDAPAVRVEVRAVGILEAEPAQMPAEFLQAVNLEGEVRQIRLHMHRPARRITAQLDQLFAARRPQENQFRTARGFVAADLFQPEHLAVELHRPFEIINAIARMQELLDLTHVLTIPRNRFRATDNSVS